VALDKKKGTLVWKADRPRECYEPLEPIGKKAYITPLIIEMNGKDMLISNGSAVCIAYDPETGAEIWRIVQGEDSTIAMPVFENGIVYFYSGFVTPPDEDKYAELLAVNPDGRGDITTSHTIWRYQSPILQLLTPLIRNGLIYTVDTRSNLICLDAKTGAVIWSEKLKGQFNSSPVYAGGNIYFSSTKGLTLVIREGRKPEFIAENRLGGEIWATPGISGRALFIRTSDYLYCISE
jgi:outer membrane protein assembly factor BamB